MVLTTRFWLKDYYSYPIVSNDGLVYYLILKQSALSNRTNNTYDNFCVTKIKYIMYNVQDYSVLYNNAVQTVM